MRKLTWVLLGAIFSIAAPAHSNAQENGEEELARALKAFFGPNWNVFVYSGPTSNGRYLLQGPIAPSGGQRALRAEDAFNVGGGAGVDLLPRVGFRMTYTYSASDLVFRTDDGDGSEDLDVENTGALRSHIAAFEIIRYMFPSRSAITPYGSAGFLGAWWMLDEQSTLVEPTGGSSQFRFGALASFGLQLRVNGGFSARLEMSSASVRNPFTGDESFRAFGGNTIDEPGRVNKTDFRLSAAYSFGRP